MSESPSPKGRRGFLSRLLSLGGVAAAPAAAQSSTSGAPTVSPLPAIARRQNYQSAKISSFDPTGGNRDWWAIPAGSTKEVFQSAGPGVITHIWFTINSPTLMHLKELVLRAYWDGNAQPSIEVPLGDFFGLNVGQYQIYESAYLACSPGRSLNCYFAMPFQRSARLTVTNEGKEETRSFYSNIDYQRLPEWPADALYFHAQYRQAAPNTASKGEDAARNPAGRLNYVYTETRGRGHLMGVTLGVQLNADGWMGEGDDMIFIDDEAKPVIIGTGSEDYFLGSWNFGGRDGAQQFGHRFYGAPLILMPERIGGKYCCYRWHGDNPVTFSKYLKHTMEHGHGNDRADNFYSCCYWYQDQPYTDFPALAPVASRIPRLHLPS